MDAGRNARDRTIVASIAFDFGHRGAVGRMRVLVDRGVTVRAGEAAVHAGLDIGALVFVAAKALCAFGWAIRRNIESKGER